MIKLFESIKLKELQKKYDELQEKYDELLKEKNKYENLTRDWKVQYNSSCNEMLMRQYENSKLVSKLEKEIEELKDEKEILEEQLAEKDKEIELYKGVISNITVHDLKENKK